MAEMNEFKVKYQHFTATFGAKPFIPRDAKGTEPSSVHDEHHWSTGATTEELPLKLGPMGSLASGRVFDLKIAGQPDFQFSAKGGDQ